MGLRLALRYLGVPIVGATRLFGDNGSVITSGSLPHSTLRKRHHAPSYHYTREAVASQAVDFHFIPGHLNPADILSKHWGYQQVWAASLRPILFWQGDTSVLLLEPDKTSARQKDQPDGRAHRAPQQQCAVGGSDRFSTAGTTVTVPGCTDRSSAIEPIPNTDAHTDVQTGMTSVNREQTTPTRGDRTRKDGGPSSEKTPRSIARGDQCPTNATEERVQGTAPNHAE